MNYQLRFRSCFTSLLEKICPQLSLGIPQTQPLAR